MLIMQLQLFQLTCKLPIWTRRGEKTMKDWRLLPSNIRNCSRFCSQKMEIQLENHSFSQSIDLQGRTHNHTQPYSECDLGPARLSLPPALASYISHRVTLPVSPSYTQTRFAVAHQSVPNRATLWPWKRRNTPRRTPERRAESKRKNGSFLSIPKKLTQSEHTLTHSLPWSAHTQTQHHANEDTKSLPGHEWESLPDTCNHGWRPLSPTQHANVCACVCVYMCVWVGGVVRLGMPVGCKQKALKTVFFSITKWN